MELGTGYGYNLFSLSLNHPDWTFKGFDISPNGIAAGREIADHFGLSDKVSFGRIDLTDAADPSLAEIEGETAFTYFCIEQIPYDVRKVVENIIAAKPKRVINIEPTTRAARPHASARSGQPGLHPLGRLPDATLYDTRRTGTSGPNSHHRARADVLCSNDQQ